ncbi:MAG TPA: VanW family protein [Chloroflexia bacterium]|nr:VanW family protein [Chloroflexia bacterium]
MSQLRSRVALAAVLLLALGAVLSPGLAAPAVLAAAPAGLSTAPVAQVPEASRYFAETGHVVRGALLDFFLKHGALARFGAPLTEQYLEGDWIYQIFDRGALQMQAGTQAVALRPLGAELLLAKNDPTLPLSGASHSINGGFREVYEALGGVEAFGAPLSDEVPENALTVQYFTAAKMSWALDRPAGQMVQVEALGREWMAQHQVPAEALQQAPPPTATEVPTATPEPPSATPVPAEPSATPTVPATASPTATVAVTATPAGGLKVPEGWSLVAKGESTYKGSSAARVHNLTLAAQRLDGVTVQPGAIFSFNRSLGDDTEKTGFVKGLIIMNGRTVEGVGGGICQVASTFFRAAFNAGFDIVERHPHSYRVSWYEPPVGIDATVFSDEHVDLRFRNNLPAPVLIRTVINAKAGTLAVLVYSQAQQPFKVTMDGPYTTNRVPHGPPIYEYDPKMKPGTVTQVDHAKDGLDVTIYRVFTDRATGKVLRREKIFSRYSPWRDIYKQGSPIKKPAAAPAKTKTPSAAPTATIPRATTPPGR